MCIMLFLRNEIWNLPSLYHYQTAFCQVTCYENKNASFISWFSYLCNIYTRQECGAICFNLVNGKSPLSKHFCLTRLSLNYGPAGANPKHQLSTKHFMLMTLRHIWTMFWTMGRKTLHFLLNCTLAIYSLNFVQLDPKLTLKCVWLASAVGGSRCHSDLAHYLAASLIVVKFCSYFLK